jgi:hypothetical protein
MGALAAQKEEPGNFFAEAEQKFFDLIKVLESRHTLGMKFSDLEKLIETGGRELLRAITIVCDIIHVIEYLWKAAWVFFDKGDKKSEEWVNERFIKILEGQSTYVAAGIRQIATKKKLSKKIASGRHLL